MGCPMTRRKALGAEPMSPGPSSTPLRPPALARWILRLALPEVVRDGFAGDLEERFHAEAAHDPAAARRRYWRDVLSPTLLRLRHEAKGQPLPPGTSPGTGRGDGHMTALLADLKFALRMIRKAPAFTAVAVLSLALGIGPNTAIFSLVDAVLFQEWGVRDPDTLVDVYSRGRDDRYYFTGWSTYELVEEGTKDTFSQVAGHTFYVGNVETGEEGELVIGEMVTGNYFDVMGVSAERGRTFLPEEDATPGTHPVVVLSDRYWRSRFGADPAMVGGQIRLNGRPYTVVGIAPDRFKGRLAPGIGTDFWVPMSMYTHLTPDQKGQGNFMITGRMKPGVTPAQAEAARGGRGRPLQRRAPGLSQHDATGRRGGGRHPPVPGPGPDPRGHGGAALRRRGDGAPDRVREPGRLPAGAGHGSEEGDGGAHRHGGGQPRAHAPAPGGGGGVGDARGALGLVLGQVALRALLSIDFPLPFPVHLSVSLNGKLVLFTLGMTAVAAFIFGFAPALNAVRTPVAATLRDESGASGTPPQGARSRQLLVGAQMAVCTMLLFGSALFVRSLRNAASQDVGFSTAPAAVVTAHTWATGYSDAQQSAFVETFAGRWAPWPACAASPPPAVSRWTWAWRTSASTSPASSHLPTPTIGPSRPPRSARATST